MCDPNNLSRDAAAMFMNGGVARSLDFFSNSKDTVIKSWVGYNPDDRKCDDCIDKTAGVAVTEVDTS